MSWRAAFRMRLGTLDLDVDLAGGGRPVALVGPNASGKTTILRTIAGAHRPESGVIEVGGRVLFDGGRGLQVTPEARRVGYVPQGYGLFPHLRVVDNVAFGAAAGGTSSRAERRAEARALLEQLDAAHLGPAWPSDLSGGEQQRVALARALMIDPDILLLDEPLAALDAPARRQLRAYLARRLAERGGPALVVTHDARDVLALDAEVYVLDGGRVIQHGLPTALAEEPANDFVAEFFGA